MCQGSGLMSKPEEAVAFVQNAKFPILVKAAFGGGGRGQRVVHSAGEVADAFKKSASAHRICCERRMQP